MIAANHYVCNNPVVNAKQGETFMVVYNASRLCTQPLQARLDLFRSWDRFRIPLFTLPLQTQFN